MRYDPLGRLWQSYGPSQGTTRYLYDGDALVAEYDSVNNMLKRYLHGPGVDEPLVKYGGRTPTPSNSYLLLGRFMQTDPIGYAASSLR